MIDLGCGRLTKLTGPYEDRREIKRVDENWREQMWVNEHLYWRGLTKVNEWWGKKSTTGHVVGWRELFRVYKRMRVEIWQGLLRVREIWGEMSRTDERWRRFTRVDETRKLICKRWCSPWLLHQSIPWLQELLFRLFACSFITYIWKLFSFSLYRAWSTVLNSWWLSQSCALGWLWCSLS